MAKKVSPSNDSKFFSNDHEAILTYAKIKSPGVIQRQERSEKHNQYYKNPDNDKRGNWNSTSASCNKNHIERPNLYYSITHPKTGEDIWPNKSAVWAFSQETMQKLIDEERLYWGVSGDSKIPRLKNFLTEAKRVVPRNILNYQDFGSTQSATSELKELMEGNLFDYPKPTKLLSGLIKMVAEPSLNDEFIILDFFAGSSTTAHSVLIENSNGKSLKKKFIMVQLPESLDVSSAAGAEGYHNIADLSRQRIRRAGAKILEENPDQKGKLDVGFRVLKIDSSNMKDVHSDPSDLKQGELLDAVSHIKADRSGEDLLFQVMLKQGIELSQPIARESVQGGTIYIVGQDNLIACFDNNISDDIVKDIAGRRPLYAIFRDESFKEPADKTNANQIFKQLTGGHTRMKVI